MAKTIELTQGYSALVDDADYPILSAFKWCAALMPDHRYVYAVRSEYTRDSRRTVFMHREIAEAGPGTYVDHINQDTLDNRRANLRLCSHSENLRNSRGHRNRLSRYKGVSRQGGRWRALIQIDGKQHYLGGFKSEEDAASAYNAAAIQRDGEFARLNDLRRADTKEGIDA